MQVIYTVENISEDQRRVLCTTHAAAIRQEADKRSEPDAPTAADIYFHDLADINVDAIRSVQKKYRKEDILRKKRYASSVSVRLHYTEMLHGSQLDIL